MPRIAYVNGQYLPHAHAQVHVEDRGYQFSDGVYEVCAIRDGRLMDLEGHLDRLDRSLASLEIAPPVSRGGLLLILRQVRDQNRLQNGVLYIQVTRGVAPRDHGFPSATQNTRPSLIVTARAISKAAGDQKAEEGVGVITTEDTRWGRCDIKSVSLLANVLAKQEARNKGAAEAWLTGEDGLVTEGASSTAWIVTSDGTLVTRPLGPEILPGITRQTLIGIARKEGIKVEERAFSVEEAKGAREAFLTAATNYVMPIVRIDDQPIGNGHPGEIATRLRALYLAAASA